jgi:iron complex outermembrane receptor protein
MRFRHLLHFFALAAISPWAMYAQSLTISGTVADTQAVPIADATVTLTTGSSAGRRVATSSASGQYIFSGLSEGSYHLTFDHAGFEAVTRSGQLTANLEVNVSLPVKGEVTSIDVVDVAGKATASRLEIPNTELPAQISVIPQALLQQQAVNNMVDALKNASGVQAFRWYGVYEYYTIRGFNQADVMLVDGMRLEGNRPNTQLNNVESVEVLKGPTSVLYGGGALAGIINVVRKKPQGTRAYDFLYKGGRFNSHQVAGSATGPVGNYNRLLYRVDASYDHSDGWRRAGGDRVNVSPTLTWLINERSRVTVHQAFNRDRFDGDGGVDINLTTLPNYDKTWRFSLPQDNVLVEDSQTHILFNTNLTNSWEFRNGFLLRRTSDRYFVTEGIYGSPATNEVFREPLDFHHTRRPVQNQADLIGRLNLLGTHHTLLAGYEYQDFFTRTDVTKGDDPTCNCGYWGSTATPINLATYDRDTYKETTPNLDITTVFRKTYQANQINAFYWQDQIDLTPQLKINIGGRYDNYERRVHRIFVANPNTRTGIQARNQNAYTYRAGIVYAPQGGHQIYFNTATSFSPVTAVPANGAELRPQRGLTYEVGHRWKSVTGRTDTSIAVYHIERDGQTVVTSQTAIEQVGLLKSKGFDADLNLQLGMGIQLRTNYGFAQAVFEDPASSLNGRTPRYVPKHTANAWLHKEWSAGFSASLGTRYVGPQFVANNNSYRLGGYNTLSGAVGLRRERWEWSLNADNLFNRGRYFIPGHFDNIVFPGAPINVSSSIRLRFN